MTMRNILLMICPLMFSTTIAFAEGETTKQDEVAPSVDVTKEVAPEQKNEEATTPTPTEPKSEPLPAATLGDLLTPEPKPLVSSPPATPPVVVQVPRTPEVKQPTPVSAPVAIEQKPRHRWVGMQFDLGVPDGAAAGLVVRPYVDWVRVGLSATHNGAAPGIRGSVTLDPINFGVAPTLTFGYGQTFMGTVPTFVSNDVPSFSYNYLNLHPGLEFGDRNSWRFFIQGGPSWINLSTRDFQKVVNSNVQNLRVADPSVHVMFNPTVKLGLTFYF
jgi:hypothetical protein